MRSEGRRMREREEGEEVKEEAISREEDEPEGKKKREAEKEKRIVNRDDKYKNESIKENTRDD